MVKKLTKDEFSKLIFDFENKKEWDYKGNKPSILKFTAEWCNPCKTMIPILEEISNEYDGKIDIYNIDVEDEDELSSYFKVRSVPTMVYLPVGEKPQTSIGSITKANLIKKMEEILKV